MLRTRSSTTNLGLLDPRYVNVTGDTMTGNLILNDNVSLLLGTGSDGELFHDGTNTYFQNNTGGIIIENDASDGDISFKVNAGGVDKTVMTIDGATGNVGIGTTNPASKLEIGYAVGYGGNELAIGDGTRAFAVDVNTSGSTIYSTSNLIFAPNSAEKVRIDTGGNVGIGTTGPVAPLHVYSTSLPGAIIEIVSDSIGTTSGFHIRAKRATSDYSLQTNDFILPMAGRGWHSGGAYSTTPKVAFYGFAAENWTSTAQGTYITMETTAIGGTSRTEKIRITDTGYVGIGTTSPYSLLDVSATTGGILTLTRKDTSVTAADLIGQIDFHTTDTQTTTNPVAAEIKVSAANTIATDINPGIMDFLVTGTGVAGALIECMSFQATTVPQIGFYGATPVVQQAYTAVSNPPTQAEVTAIRDALVNLGLMASS